MDDSNRHESRARYLFYTAWNLAIVLPIIAALNVPSVRENRAVSWLIVAGIYAVSASCGFVENAGVYTK